jgi:RHS repeat-associated protein
MPMPIDRNGYIAVYTESRTLMPLGPCTTCGDVFFDNLSVRVTSGRLKEETHYYPFGLPMKGMGTDAGNNVLNRQKYQSNEYIKELGLNWMSFGARQYDPQLGRFLSIDPLADGQGQQIWSPYSAMGNAPESMIDPNGESVIDMQSMVMINGASPVWNESDAYADHNQGNGYEPPPDLEEMAAAGFEYLAEATQANSGNSGNENTVVAVFVNVVDGGSMTLANASTTDATKETGETTKSDGDQQQNGGSGNFFADNWQDVAFMANDLAQAVGNNSSLNTALRMGRPTTMLYVPPGVSIPVSTKVMSTVSKVGTPIAKAAPWVAGFAIGTDIYNNQSISWGNVYQGTVLGLSLIPGAGLIVGGLSLIAEGVSYYYTGQSISDNINQRTNVIYNFK